MPMTKDDLSRRFFLDVTKDGAVFVRERGTGPRGGLPVYSTDTRDEAEALVVRHCRLARDGSGIYRLNDPPAGVDDLGRISDLFRTTAEKRRALGLEKPLTDRERDLVADFTAQPEDVVLVDDLREGAGTHRPRVRVVSIDSDGDADCILVRSGKRKKIRVLTLSKAYRLVERNYKSA